MLSPEKRALKLVRTLSTDLVFEFFSGDNTDLADAKDSLATSEALGCGGWPEDSGTRLAVVVCLLTLEVFVGVLPRLGNIVAQPKGCFVGETCVEELLA